MTYIYLLNSTPPGTAVRINLARALSLIAPRGVSFVPAALGAVDKPQEQFDVPGGRNQLSLPTRSSFAAQSNSISSIASMLGSEVKDPALKPVYRVSAKAFLSMTARCPILDMPPRVRVGKWHPLA